MPENKQPVQNVQRNQIIVIGQLVKEFVPETKSRPGLYRGPLLIGRLRTYLDHGQGNPVDLDVIIPARTRSDRTDPTTLKVGTQVSVRGFIAVEPFINPETHRRQSRIFISAYSVRVSDYLDNNTVYLDGYVARNSGLTTTRGKRNRVSVLLAVPRPERLNVVQNTEKEDETEVVVVASRAENVAVSDYVPCVFLDGNAEYAVNFQLGDRVEVAIRRNNGRTVGGGELTSFTASNGRLIYQVKVNSFRHYKNALETEEKIEEIIADAETYGSTFVDPATEEYTPQEQDVLEHLKNNDFGILKAALEEE